MGRRGSTGFVGVATVCCALAVACRVGAQAAERSTAQGDPAHKSARAPQVPSPLGVHTSVGAALDNAAFVATLGGRYRANDLWLFGLDGEFNPWYSLDTNQFRLGTLNVYATTIKRYPIDHCFGLRSSVHLGTSVLLFDVIGAPAGSVGLYLGISLLGLDYKFSDQFTLVIDPAQVAVPVPHLTGAPLSYRQYRFMIGLQFGA